MSFHARLFALAGTVAAVLAPPAVHAGGTPHAARVVSVLGDRAVDAFAPVSGQLGALVAVPEGARAADLGLVEVAPGIARFRGTPAALQAFTGVHPGVHVEVAPPLHPTLDNAGKWVRAGIARFLKNVDGKGTLVGVADTGLDVTHPDLLDASGKSRVAWMLDLSLPPQGFHPDLEEKYGVKDSGGTAKGAVLTGADIDQLIAAKTSIPTDEVGHGTHVTSIATGNGGLKNPTPYTGVAPGARIVFVRLTRDTSEAIENDDLVRGVQFIYDRADAEKQPVVLNLSLGSDFGPHDGSFLWENVLASFVGPDKPGHALVVAAGNSGSIAELPIHQSVHVPRATRMRVPVATSGASKGAVQIWVAMRAGANLSVGLEGPDGEWIAPVPDGNDAGKNGGSYNAGVVNGATAQGGNGPIPKGSHGAVVVWQGSWPKGEYAVLLEGEGTADLFLQGGGDVGPTSPTPVAFEAGVREGTINLPATHPQLLAVGCTVNRIKWTSIDKGDVALHAPILDEVGGSPVGSHTTRNLADGEVCWFSSAGPTVTGIPKPEISAPGGLVIAAMSKQAAPGTPGSVFTNPSCPPLTKGGDSDPKCLQVDTTHAVAVGTSMSAPLVSGAIALLFQVDPTLTQDKLTALLQAGAHPFRGDAPFWDQAGPGELDVLGALSALEQMKNPATYLPSLDKSWITPSADYIAADGSTPITAIVELRTDDGHMADLLGDRLQAVVKLDGRPTIPPAIVRRAPGVYTYTLTPPAGLGGSSITLGATFDGADIVAPKSVMIAADIWNSEYGGHARGGCAAPSAPADTKAASALLVVGAVVVSRWRRRRRR